MRTNEIKVNFLGWDNVFAKFEIQGTHLYDGQRIRYLVVACEGDWTDDLRGFYPDITFYEEVQNNLGSGLEFIDKEYCPLLKRSFFKFKLEDPSPCLVVPASGEELHFEIYGLNAGGSLLLLLEQEL